MAACSEAWILPKIEIETLGRISVGNMKILDYTDPCPAKMEKKMSGDLAWSSCLAR